MMIARVAEKDRLRPWVGDILEMPIKRASTEAKSGHVFGQARRPAKMLRAGLYARVSTNDQQTLPMQSRALREYAGRRGWTVSLQVREVNSGAAKREDREKLLEAAPPPRDRCRAGVAVGPLGPVGNGFAGDTPGTGASGCGLRVADRGAGPDYTRRASDGGTAGRLRRIRTGDLG